MSQTKRAKKFGCSQSQIGSIAKRKANFNDQCLNNDVPSRKRQCLDKDQHVEIPLKFSLIQVQTYPGSIVQATSTKLTRQ